MKLAERIDARLQSLGKRRADCWRMADVFRQHGDHHGMHDMGVEIAALERAIAELTAVKEGQ